MMTPTASKFADDGHAQQQQNLLPTTSRRTSSAPAASSSAAVRGTICSSVTLFPLHALQRLMQCFGYTHSVTMQSGRTYAWHGARGGGVPLLSYNTAARLVY